MSPGASIHVNPISNQIHVCASSRGITDYFFCFVCDEYDWECDHLIVTAVTRAPGQWLVGDSRRRLPEHTPEPRSNLSTIPPSAAPDRALCRAIAVWA